MSGWGAGGGGGALSSTAAAFAADRHGAREAAHPAEAGALLAAAGEEDALVAAGILHDVVEDTGTAAAEVRERFGDRVADLVEALTEDPGIEDYVARKRELRARIAAGGRDAAVVSAADKLSKVRELARTGAEIHPAKAAHYDASAASAVRRAPGHPLTAALVAEWAAVKAAR